MRKTDTLTGRELTRPASLPTKKQALPTSRHSTGPVDRESLKEYRWRVEDDEDNLKEDVLAPKYSSF